MTSHNRKISVVGLGYVGLPVAVAFGKTARSIGFDVNTTRIDELKNGHDGTLEVTSDELRGSDILFTADAADLRGADFHIVAVPTPIDQAKRPDLTPVLRASETLGAQLKAGDIVVYESTVYPGATEEDCVPVLERVSGLKCGKDFFVGYSPERINPGDKEHTFTKITKVVAGQNAEILDIVANVYASVVTAGVHRAATIKVAEAAKVIENTQRDLNISLMNELALIFDRMDIDTRDVLAAAGTKWNFLPFRPGLVGGHCIGVDPYYLIHKSKEVGYTPELILSGRKINEHMGQHLTERVSQLMVKKNITISGARILIMGFTFKENCPDIRNTRVIDVYNNFRKLGCEVDVFDPWVDKAEVRREYQIDIINAPENNGYDAILIAVAHNEFKQYTLKKFRDFAKPTYVLFDAKYLLDKENVDGRL